MHKVLAKGAADMTVYGYARVSTDGQSLTSQDAELHAAGCAKVYAEKISGARSNRPELANVLKRLDTGDVLIVTIHFKETPAHSSYDWHPDPEPQFVITLSGTLEFATPDGGTFILRPGDVLVAVDHIGKGHKW